jgi:transcriptional regulator
MLYNPPAFRETDLAALHAQILGTGLTTLITVGDNGSIPGPIVSQLPMLLDPKAGPSGTLTGHLARGNPQWKDSDFSKPAIAMFIGPDAYVSPSWYPSKAEHGKTVPTWNYSLIYVRGMIETFDDAEELRAHVTALTERFERDAPAPWKVSDAPEDYLQRQFKGIVGLRLTIDTIEGKAKLSQNRTKADQDGVIAALSASERSDDRAISGMMQQRSSAKA